MKCDSCGKEVAEVKRIVVDDGYDRSLAKPLYNCPDCYAKKEDSRKKNSSGGPPTAGSLGLIKD